LQQITPNIRRDRCIYFIRFANTLFYVFTFADIYGDLIVSKSRVAAYGRYTYLFRGMRGNNGPSFPSTEKM